MTRFAGKVALITGAGRGIGKAAAERFAREGAMVALIDNNADDLLRTEEQFKVRGWTSASFVTDVTDAGKVNEVVEHIVAKWERIDILANNAGIAWEEDFLKMTPENWRKINDVNLNGMFYVAQAVSRQMAVQCGGAIINMASTNGFVGEPKYAHYNASKGGVILLTKTMAVELGGYNIRVNAICPGYIQTPMSEEIDSAEFVADYIRNHIPLGRVGKPEDVAGLFAFLASDDASFITGATIVIDGGQLAF